MWGDKDNNVWLHYVKNIIAADLRSAIFLASYIRSNSITKNHARYLEVIDLQKYKIINNEVKVRTALSTRADVPFVFVIGKN